MKPPEALLLVSGGNDQTGAAGQLLHQLRAELIRCGLQARVALETFAPDAGAPPDTPTVIVYPQAVAYAPFRTADIPALIQEHLLGGRILTERLAPQHGGRFSWLETRKGALPAQYPIALSRMGKINPASIEDYLAQDGYHALRQALTEMRPAEIIECVHKSGLQGRGGAGFPTGLKWRFVAGSPGSKKYVVCNADESEPGTFKDRVILENDPHSLIEAMLIAAYAVGADEGYIYVRGEYKTVQQVLYTAIGQAYRHGFLGKNILGSGFSFDIHVHSGAGAYICGEETALLESLEGRRGEPRIRPPYPTTSGLWNRPTLVNNVETLVKVPHILRHGWQWYRQFGTPGSPGTKIFTIIGNVNRPGVIEVPFGITLREVLGIYAGGMRDGKRCKLAQTGGSSGSIVPASLQDTPIDFNSYKEAGVSLGSGALLICSEDTCVVDLGRVIMRFFRYESCGKCTPCRVGTERAFAIFNRLSSGQGRMEDLDELEYIAQGMAALSNCGLGSTASVPVRDILKHYRAEVEAHVRLKVCPTGVCAMQASRPISVQGEMQ
ncbi:MAG: NADH-quinone oxidoreductase subunit NuoF [Anaerolineales bacterium]